MGAAAASNLNDLILHGALGRQFGRRHRLAVRSPAEAVRAMCANYPAFERELITSEQRGIGYRVFVGRHAIDADELHTPAGAAAIRIAPVVTGAKGGGKSILGGIALIGLSFVPGLQGITLFGSTTLAGVIGNIGFSMLLGGIAQMMSPTPKAQAPTERPENKPSTYFDGPVNTTAQGQPVPVGYGEMIIGSAVVSAGITAEDAPL